jgi:hypothetical protein
MIKNTGKTFELMQGFHFVTTITGLDRRNAGKYDDNKTFRYIDTDHNIDTPRN